MNKKILVSIMFLILLVGCSNRGIAAYNTHDANACKNTCWANSQQFENYTWDFQSNGRIYNCVCYRVGFLDDPTQVI